MTRMERIHADLF